MHHLLEGGTLLSPPYPPYPIISHYAVPTTATQLWQMPDLGAGWRDGRRPRVPGRVAYPSQAPSQAKDPSV